MSVSQGNQVVRYVTAAGILTTVAGTAGSSGTTGDGGLATSARLNNPAISADGTGGWLVTDTWNNVVRRLTLRTATQTPTASRTASRSPSVGARPWNIFRAAGTGTSGSSADWTPATSANLGGTGVACKDATGAGGFYFVSAGEGRGERGLRNGDC
jgi:hypothetical protein